MMYFASNRALAVLEALVHLPPVDIPYEYCMVTIDAPDDFKSIDEKTLPKNWQDPSDQDRSDQDPEMEEAAHRLNPKSDMSRSLFCNQTMTK